MTNQDIFNTLADNEMKLAYAYFSDNTNEELKAAWTAAKQALEAFAKATGCHN